MKDIEELINKTINEETEENIRLPVHLKPIHYRLKLFPILDEFSEDNFTYTGEVKITVRCLSKTNKIVMNLDDLDITEQNVTVLTVKATVLRYENTNNKESDSDQPDIYQKNATAPNNTVIIVDADESNNSTDEVLIGRETTSLVIQEVYKEAENYKLIIVMRNLLEVDHNYTINIKFSGNITNNLAGFYRTSYKGLEGETRWVWSCLATRCSMFFQMVGYDLFSTDFCPSRLPLLRRTQLQVFVRNQYCAKNQHDCPHQHAFERHRTHVSTVSDPSNPVTI
jgi:hypothetical protein